MAALRSAFFIQVSNACRRLWPLVWMAKSISVVVPPNAAAIVPGFKIVRAGGAAERHVQVRVNVDSARHHQPPGGVDHLSGVFDGQRLARWR